MQSDVFALNLPSTGSRVHALSFIRQQFKPLRCFQLDPQDPFPLDPTPHKQNAASPPSPSLPLVPTAATPTETQMYRHLLRQPALALGVVGISTLGSSGDQQHRPCSASSPSPPRTPLLPFRGPAAAAEALKNAKTEDEKRAEQDSRRKFLWERTRVRTFTRVLLLSFSPFPHPHGSPASPARRLL